MEATGRGQLAALTKTITAFKTEAEVEQIDQQIMEILQQQAVMTPQERVLQYLRGFKNTLKIDFQVYKDLKYCIQEITKGQLGKIDIQADLMLEKAKTMVNTKGGRRFSAMPNVDGLMWAQ